MPLTRSGYRLMLRFSALRMPLLLQAALVCLTASSAAGQVREASRHTAGASASQGAWLNLVRSLPALMDSGGVPGMSVAVVEAGRLHEPGRAPPAEAARASSTR